MGYHRVVSLRGLVPLVTETGMRHGELRSTVYLAHLQGVHPVPLSFGHILKCTFQAVRLTAVVKKKKENKKPCPLWRSGL